MLVVVLIAALMAAVVMGHLQIGTEEVQLMQNHIRGAEALATAEAGLNDALAQLRQNANWNTGFVGKPFAGGSYTVVVNGSTVASMATTSAGFTAKVEAEITTAPGGPPYVIRINRLRINE